MEQKLTTAVLVSGGLGLKALKHLQSRENVIAVLTDKKSDEIISYCKTQNIPVFAGNPGNGKANEFILNHPADVLASVNYLFIVDQSIISWPKKIAFNVHGSLLPKYRGRTPHVWAIINGENKCGITAHLIDEGCDTGDIIEQIEIAINSDDTGNKILEKYSEKYPEILDLVFGQIKSESLNVTKQDHSKATFFGKRTPEDGEINWEWQKERIFNWVRAMALPYPRAFTHLNSQKLLINKICFSDCGFEQEMQNGLIISVSPLLVKTQNGVIEICEYELEKSLLLKENDVFG